MLPAEDPLAVRVVLCRDGELPGGVGDAVLAHPAPRARGHFVVNPHGDPAQRARLVDDLEWLVRHRKPPNPRPRPSGPRRLRPLAVRGQPLQPPGVG
ncbi:hypothetical protein [Streptomyces monashensis]|uniref:hypothetical protein n=1 Tax=Streptomyces monashensis TaxID=1678012 RepID=UPI0011603778|nr:hypothetical protein [Streptomyces monashensis]